MTTDNQTKKCGFVSLIGKPNAGKSTLLNALLKQKLSVVTNKAQTTRNKIQGILTEKNYQIIFLDTPGILEPKYELQNFMLKELNSALRDSDLAVYLIDAGNFNIEDLRETENKYSRHFSALKRIPVLNKIDLIDANKEKEILDEIKKIFPIDDIVSVSAIERINLDLLLKKITDLLPQSEFYFDEDTLTDKPEKFFVSEIIREKIFEMFEDEIPYSTFVDIREFKERENSKDYINADIIIERETQKIIIIGKKGEKIKKLGEAARADIEKFLGKEIFLQLFVKTRKDWRKDHNFLKHNF